MELATTVFLMWGEKKHIYTLDKHLKACFCEENNYFCPEWFF